MEAIELRDKIIQLINTDNVYYLKDIFDFAENKKITISEDEIVSYTVQGQPLTKAMYIKKVGSTANLVGKTPIVTSFP